MIKNYFKVAWRNLWKNKTFSIINIWGLTIGIVCAALIFLWIEYQYKTNSSFNKADNIYILKNNQQYGNDIVTFSSTSGPTGPGIQQEIPGFENVSRTLDNSGVFGVGEKFLSYGGLYADSNFFSIFSFPVRQQAPDFSLADPTHIAISSNMARSFFNNENPIGKTISLNKKDLFTIKMTYDFPDENITLKPHFVFSLKKGYQDSSFAQSWSQWGQCGMRTYASLKDNVQLEKINEQLQPFIKSKSENKVSHEVFLYPLMKLAIYNSFKNGVEQPREGRIKYIRLFGAIAIIILVIACINFMNLSTARSERRAKEIGLKKVVGATRPQLIRQFLFESILTALGAVVLAILLLYISVPLFGRMLDIPLSFTLLDPLHVAGLFSIGLFCGLLAGSYPSLYLSSFNPMNALKKQRASGRLDTAAFIRKGLVVTQFSVAIILIIAIIVIYGQINHARNRDLGYDLDKVVSVRVSEQIANKYNVVRQQLISNDIASNISFSTSSILGIYNNGGGYSWAGKDDAQDPLISFVGIDENFFPTMNMPLAEGRNFTSPLENEGANVIINDALAKLMGKEGKAGGKIYRGDSENYTIAGITQPFLFNDLYAADQPVLFFAIPPQQSLKWGGSMYVKLSSKENIKTSLEKMESTLKQLDSGLPFSYQFLNEQYDALFKGTKFIGNLALIFGILAIFISCMGLFGLSAYMAEQRTREVGVRKVLGASMSGITTLLSKDFLKLVSISIVIAIPVAWYYMTDWLQSFEYRITLGWWIFLFAALLALAIALLTVSFQAIKAARTNPVKSLRSE